MRASLVAILVLAFTAWAANVRLYLNDGGYQLVREYQVQADRVRFYSVERSEWEEVPLDLVDLKRTEAEAASRKAESEKTAQALRAEDKVESDLRNEASSIPQAPGVYWIEGGKTKVLKQAETTLRTDKARSILQRISPLPTTSGKGTVEIDGAHSASVFTDQAPEFYIQLSETERFGFARLTPKGTARIASFLAFAPVTKDVEQTPDMIPTLQLQLDDGLYKIWPKDPLAPGEYAVVQYSGNKVDIQVWDFAVKQGLRP